MVIRGLQRTSRITFPFGIWNSAVGAMPRSASTLGSRLAPVTFMPPTIVVVLLGCTLQLSKKRWVDGAGAVTLSIIALSPKIAVWSVVVVTYVHTLFMST